MDRKYIWIIFLYLFIFANACSTFSLHLNREVLTDEKIMPGNYTVIFYGARHGEDLETIAVLDYEGDEFTFEPFAREYDYKLHEHVGDEEALIEAMKFISWYPSFVRAQLSRLTDKQGRILGYELRPLYSPIVTFGHSDVLRVHYQLKDKKVIIYIRLERGVERAIEGNGDESDEIEE